MAREKRLNIQGLARREKGLMSALVPKEGHVFVSIDLSAGEPTCYQDSVTEFLTQSGWKRFDDITEGEKIAQVCPTTRNLQFVHPTARTKFLAEEFVELSGKTARYSVTKTHKVLYVNPNRPKKAKITTAECPPNTHDYALQTACNTRRISCFSTSEIWIAALIAADGSKDGKKWDISLYRDRKKIKAEELLGPATSVRIDKRKDSYLHGLRWRVTFESALLNPKTKELDLSALGINQVHEFVAALLFWDGSRRRFFS